MRELLRHSMKLNNVHLAISAFAALAGVVIAAIQTFGSGGSAPPPDGALLATARTGPEVTTWRLVRIRPRSASTTKPVA